MYRIPQSGLILFSVAALMAADASWRTKPIANWTEDDAHQILSDSPWAKATIAAVAPMQSEAQRREGGNMGQPHGVGYDGINNGKAPIPNLQSLYGGPMEMCTAPVKQKKSKCSWFGESAMPVRLAELKAHDIEPPTLSEDGYSIAVYGVLSRRSRATPRKPANP